MTADDRREYVIGHDEALVLFEFLTREIDERNGAGLAAAMTCEAEYWALNSLQGVLERTLFQTFAADYAAQVGAARARLTPPPDPSNLVIACEAEESSAMRPVAE